MTHLTLTTPDGHHLEGTLHDDTWTPTGGHGLAFTLTTLLAHGWSRTDTP